MKTDVNSAGFCTSGGGVLQLRLGGLRAGCAAPSEDGRVRGSARLSERSSRSAALPPCGVPERLRVDVAVESFECECEAVCPSFASQEFSFKKQSCSYEVAYWSQNL